MGACLCKKRRRDSAASSTLRGASYHSVPATAAPAAATAAPAAATAAVSGGPGTGSSGTANGTGSGTTETIVEVAAHAPPLPLAPPSSSNAAVDVVNNSSKRTGVNGDDDDDDDDRLPTAIETTPIARDLNKLVLSSNEEIVTINDSNKQQHNNVALNTSNDSIGEGNTATAITATPTAISIASHADATTIAQGRHHGFRNLIRPLMTSPMWRQQNPGHTPAAAAAAAAAESDQRHTARSPSVDRSEKISTDEIKRLILELLKVIRKFVSNEQEPPVSLLRLNAIAEKDGGWELVAYCLIQTIPLEHPLGPAVITLFLDEGPLPTKETTMSLFRRLRLGDLDIDMPPAWHRNTCIVLGCLAEKLAGSGSVYICSDATIKYLIHNLKPSRQPQVILHAIIALEKFALTRENRLTINHRLNKIQRNPLMVLELWLRGIDDPLFKADLYKQQVSFCAQWSLDNIFEADGRQYSYHKYDLTNYGALLNHDDVSEYLKLASSGLEARCDVTSFESVRCTFEATEGVWFYEALIMTPGVMQIGFATKQSRFCNHEGFGIGDDDCSIGYDGCRRLIWFNAKSKKIEHPPWRIGDFLGCLLNIPEGYVQFYLNGRMLQTANLEFLQHQIHKKDVGYFAAASFMSFQQCRFNFGKKPFQHPPKDIQFKTFNECGVLSRAQRTILPRRKKMELLAKHKVPVDSCLICFAHTRDTILKPCGHGGICLQCSKKVELCPMCRESISQRLQSSKSISFGSRPPIGLFSDSDEHIPPASCQQRSVGRRFSLPRSGEEMLAAAAAAAAGPGGGGGGGGGGAQDADAGHPTSCSSPIHKRRFSTLV